MEGKTARGASSPAKPALHIPDPLSTTKAATSSDIFNRVESSWKRRMNEDITLRVDTCTRFLRPGLSRLPSMVFEKALHVKALTIPSEGKEFTTSSMNSILHNTSHKVTHHLNDWEKVPEPNS